MRYPDGAIHIGEWRSGIPLDLYEGDLLDGLPHGHGVLTTLEGNRYEGQWKGGLPHGTGTKQWSDGSSYEGAWKRGIIHGLGRMTWVRKVRGANPDSEFEETLESQFLRFRAHGHGKLTLGTITLDVHMDHDTPTRLIDHNGPGGSPIEITDNREILDYIDRIREQLGRPTSSQSKTSFNSIGKPYTISRFTRDEHHHSRQTDRIENQ